MNKHEKAYWVAINHHANIGSRRFNILLNSFPNILMLQNTPTNEIVNKSGLPYKLLQNLKVHLEQIDGLKLLQKIESQGISIMTLKDSNYPELLANIYDPPPILYWKGNPDAWHRLDSTLAMIGTRRATSYGKHIARQFSRELAQYGITTVSGMAYGIDTEVHKGTLEVKNGCTVAILGCGVDIVYPKSNQSIYEQIQQHGLIISEFPPGHQPKPWTFPIRNRIVSGLSRGVIVIEAGKKSGTLITVDCANEQGREVFAVPGQITNPYAQGTHSLIQQGAHLLTSIQEVFEVLNCNTTALHAEELRSGSHLDLNKIDLTALEKDVYLSLENRPQHIDIIGERCQSDSTSIASILTLLEIKGVIEQLPGKLFIKKKFTS